MHGYENSITLSLPGMSAIYLKLKPKPKKKVTGKEKTEKTQPVKKAKKATK